MHRLTLISGGFGQGDATYEAGTFRLPYHQELGLDSVEALAQQGVVANNSALGAVWGGVKGALALGPIGAVIGIVAAPAPAPAVIAAAVEGGIGGLLTGGRRNLAVLHVQSWDGRHFSALCAEDLPPLLGREIELARRMAQRRPGPAWNSGEVLAATTTRHHVLASPHPPKLADARQQAVPLTGVVTQTIDAVHGVVRSTGTGLGSAAIKARATARSLFARNQKS